MGGSEGRQLLGHGGSAERLPVGDRVEGAASESPRTSPKNMNHKGRQGRQGQHWNGFLGVLGVLCGSIACGTLDAHGTMRRAPLNTEAQGFVAVSVGPRAYWIMQGLACLASIGLGLLMMVRIGLGGGWS